MNFQKIIHPPKKILVTQVQIRLLICFTMLCFVLTGCFSFSLPSPKVIQVHTKINQDESGEMVFRVGFAVEKTPSANEKPPSLDGCKPFGIERGKTKPTVTLERYEGLVWCNSFYPFENLNKLRSLYEDLVITKTIVKRENKIIYDVDLSAGLKDTDMPVDVDWILVLPGSIQSSNANTIIGNALTWKLNGSVDYFYAESQLEPTPEPTESNLTWSSLGSYLANNTIVVLIGLIASIISIWVFIREMREKRK